MIKMVKLMESITILKGHLTPTEKKVVRLMISKNMKSGSVNKKDYFLTDMGDGKWEVVQKYIDKGLVSVPGTKPRLSTYTTIIKVK